MKIESLLDSKGLMRFTGPPENWLTAIKYMTWGVEEKYLSGWKKMQPGDLFFLHSTGKSSFGKPQSSILGIGVLGSDFKVKEDNLWLYEIENNHNRWPLLVPIAEIYLFSKIDDPKEWEAPRPENHGHIPNLIEQLLHKSVPFSNIDGFPAMGSFSSVSRQVAEQILLNERELHLFEAQVEDNVISTSKPSKLEPLKVAEEALRYTESLKEFDDVKHRIIKKSTTVYHKNNDLLSKAEHSHGTILQQLLDLFKSKGYQTTYSRFIDLFAYNDDQSFLIEVKSTENKNFRRQARKGIVQLFEYDYFDVPRHLEENNLSFSKQHRLLVTSQAPNDERYINFMNSIDIGAAVMQNSSLVSVGESSSAITL